MEFLRQVIHDLARQKINWGEIAIVTPNKRAGLFLKQYILDCGEIPKPVWMPQLFSIQEFVSNISDLVLLDNLTLIFKLFPVYTRIFKSPRDFDSFYPWGQVVLSDFNEIDLYLTDREKLFKQLKDLSHIDMEFGTGGRMVEDFVQFSASLQELYFALIDQLIQDRNGYYGLALRQCVEAFEISTFSKWEHIVFAGFNALSKGESDLMQQLVDANLAQCYWDTDRAMLDDENQEAGFFIRQNPLVKNADEVRWISDDIGGSPKTINLVGVAGRVAQAKVLGSMLAQNNTRGEETAVVLGDESLLFPVLHAMPDSIQKINVTMGYPLKMTSLYHLMESIFDLHLHGDQDEQEHVRFLHARSILLHPYILPFAENTIRDLVRDAEKDNQVLVSINELNALHKTIGLIFASQNTVSGLISLLKDLLRSIGDQLKDDKQLSMEVEILFQFYTRLQRLEDILQEYSINMSLLTFRKLFQDVVASASVPFLGEPLQGLQVMGLLETRTLDFKHVYLLSANEGILPAAESQQSFIPFEVRQANGMMTHAHSDAVFAYYFYRLFKQAETVTLFYSTLTDAFGKGERSRFIDQLLHEFKGRYPNLKFHEKTVHSEAEFQKPDPIVVAKADEILNEIKAMTFSPTRLQTFVDCSLKFYFRYILNLKEKEEVVESADARIFGTVIHEVLEHLFEPYENQPLTRGQLDSMLERYPEVVESVYLGEMGQVNIRKGRNYLNCEIIKKLVQIYLAGEKPGKVVLSSEKEYFKSLEVDGVPIQLKGIVDRIEKTGEIVNIIDFKTGMIKSLQFDLMEDRSLGDLLEILRKQTQVLQLLFYGYIAGEAVSSGEVPLRLGIYSFKEQKDEGRARFLTQTRNKPYVFDASQAEVLIAPVLRAIFLDLLDVNNPFEQTDDPEKCRICPYADVCGR